MIINYKKILILCGIIAPILFTIQLIIIGSLHPNYNHLTQYMSELGAIKAPYASINNLSFSIGGLLIFLYSIGLYKTLYDNPKKKLLTIGFLLLIISSLSFLLIGFYPCDPDCINFTSTGIIHGHLSNAAQLPLIIAPLFFLPTFKRKINWNNIYIYSILTIIFGLLFFTIYKLNIIQGYTGLLQRISFGIPILWIEIMAIKTYMFIYKKS